MSEKEAENLQPQDNTKQDGDESKTLLDGKVENNEDGKSTLQNPKESSDQGLPKNEAPEKYEDFKLPEGFESDSEILENFKTIAKETGLSQEKAQGFVDLAAQLFQKAQEHSEAAFVQTRHDWVKSLQADSEYGGVKFNQTINAANRALNKAGSPELVAFLQETGFGDHPELIKMLAKFDKMTSEDHTVAKTDAAKPRIPTAQVFYGKT